MPTMQKLINRPEDFVDEMLDGILAAHSDQLRRGEDPRVILRADAPVSGKVGIVTGGGSGHLPVFMGYVGRGLADGAAIGDVFASPSADQMQAAMRGVDGGRGVLQIYGNYGGDVMNFGLAAELAEAEGMEVATILGADDVASAPRGEEARRRGIAGIFFLYKVAGAAAERGDDLAKVVAVTERAAAGIRSMGVALAPCTVPQAGHPTFELPRGEMEIGMGIHGEPGVRRGPLESADAVTDHLVDALLEDLPDEGGDRVEVLLNGLGATPVEELYIMYRRVAARLADAGLTARRAWIGEYATSLEMAGASISLLRTDDELAGLLDAPVSSPFLVRR
ncbi:MAG TPA: dihydroxyacetone kinase subunit DhaK [Candidatus Dormibacteraeota bacterium]|jgi:dihydroxyacetone kinase|nr:dihydroxyacetone kinase subunit DhaK [Candidatus Dormibacteraeota bacterium]